jgi:hypothetical protein
MRDDSAAPEPNGRMHPGTVAQERPPMLGRKPRYLPHAFALLTEVHFRSGKRTSVALYLNSLAADRR